LAGRAFLKYFTMKRILYILSLLLTVNSFGQIKISELPAHLGSAASGYAPVVIGGTTFKMTGNQLAWEKIDSVFRRSDSLFTMKHGVTTFVTTFSTGGGVSTRDRFGFSGEDYFASEDRSFSGRSTHSFTIDSAYYVFLVARSGDGSSPSYYLDSTGNYITGNFYITSQPVSPAFDSTVFKPLGRRSSDGLVKAANSWGEIIKPLARTAISLTTNFTTGAATYDNATGILNIPTVDLQGVTDAGASTTNSIQAANLTSQGIVQVQDQTNAGQYGKFLFDNGIGVFNNNANDAVIRWAPGYFYIHNSATRSGRFITTSLTSDRDWTMQNASGTVAFLSDIPSLTGYVQTTRSISTTYPLQGGGDFSADRTHSLDTSSGKWRSENYYDTKYLTSSSTVPLNKIAAASGTNTINNGANVQEWQWNSLNSGEALTLSSNNTGVSGGSVQTLLKITASGASTNSGTITKAAEFLASRSGTTASNYGIYARAVTGNYLNTGVYGLASGGGDNTGGSFLATGSGALNYANYLTASGGTTNYGSYSDVNQASATNYGYRAVVIGASSTNYGARLSASSGTTNYGLYVGASGGTNNYAIVVPSGSGNVGFGTVTPAASALLDMSSTSQGLLPPRMTAVQRLAISSPATGLWVYDTDSTRYFWFDGSVWVGVKKTTEGGGSSGITSFTDGDGFDGTVTGTDLSLKTSVADKSVLYSSSGALAASMLTQEADYMLVTSSGGSSSDENAPFVINAHEDNSKILDLRASGGTVFNFSTSGGMTIVDMGGAPSTPSAGYGIAYVEGGVFKFKNDAGVVTAMGSGGSGITIGTTAITSGTSTRVLFDDGGVVGEDAGFVYNKVTDKITVGAGINFGAYSSVEQGTLFGSPGIITTVSAGQRWIVTDNGPSGAILDLVTGSYPSYDNSYLKVHARMEENQGADVASANDLTLGLDGNTFEITGTTQINLINNSSWSNGSIIHLVFTSTPLIKNGQTTSGSNITILLAGASDFSATAGDVLTLVLSEVGGTQAWREISRSVN
jgi:hypothetical protein